MEVILATAFGRAVDIQRGESDELTETAYHISQFLSEGQLTSREMMYLISSEFFWLLVSMTIFLCVHIFFNYRQLSMGCSFG